MSDDVFGPIDFVLMEFPPGAGLGPAAGALLDLVDAGIVRLYDVALIEKAADGTVKRLALDSLAEAQAGFGLFGGAQSGLLTDDDVAEAGSAMDAGTVGVLLVYENAWAVPFVRAALGADGQMVASQRIPAQDLTDALDALEN